MTNGMDTWPIVWTHGQWHGHMANGMDTWHDMTCSTRTHLVHDLANLFGVSERKTAAQNREILRVHKARPPVDLALSSHHAVAGVVLLLHPEVGATVVLQLVVLAEGAFVDQQFYSFPGSQLAALVLYQI